MVCCFPVPGENNQENDGEKVSFKECDIENVGFYANRILKTEVLNWLQRHMTTAFQCSHSGEKQT